MAIPPSDDLSGDLSGDQTYDVCIIGAGIIGCTLARELSRYRISAVVLERGDDVGVGATKANSGIVHGGYAAKAGTRKGQLCRRGNRMYRRLEDQLHFGYRETGSLVLAFEQREFRTFQNIRDNGTKNGVLDIEIIDGDTVSALEPALPPHVIGALHCPTSGVVSPYEMAIAMAENASANNVEFRLNAEVTDINRHVSEPRFTITTSASKTRISARYVVNAAGVYSDRITAMALGKDAASELFAIIPRQGQYIVFEKGYGEMIRRVLFQPPTKDGKGILVAPTYHQNLLIGPNADEIPDREDVGTTERTLMRIIHTAKKSIPQIDVTKAITTYAGIRATSSTGDFVIGESPLPGFILAAGIDSPGLTSSPAIAEELRDELAAQGLDLLPDPSFNPHREPIVIKKVLHDAETERRIKDNGPTGIACRCERVMWSEIADALSRPVSPATIDAVKRRTRAGMGKCQGAFCSSRVAGKIEEIRGLPADQALALRDSQIVAKKRIKTALIKVKGGKDE